LSAGAHQLVGSVLTPGRPLGTAWILFSALCCCRVNKHASAKTRKPAPAGPIGSHREKRMTVDDTALDGRTRTEFDGRTRTARIPRTRGAVSGALLILLGAWGGLAPFIGPYFDYSFGSDQTWHWTNARGWLEVLPGAVVVVGGWLVLISKH